MKSCAAETFVSAFLVVVQFDKEASQTRDPVFALPWYQIPW